MSLSQIATTSTPVILRSAGKCATCAIAPAPITPTRIGSFIPLSPCPRPAIHQPGAQAQRREPACHYPPAIQGEPPAGPADLGPEGPVQPGGETAQRVLDKGP